MGDHGVEGELLFVGAEEFEGGAHVTGFAGPGAEDLELLAGDDVRIPGDGAGVAVVAEDKILSPIATHFHAFGDGAGVADTFEDDVRAVAAREIANGGDTGFGCFDFVDVDDVVRAETFCHFKTRSGRAEDNDFGGTGGFCDGECGDANGASTLDDDDVLPIDAGPFDAVNGGD